MGEKKPARRLASSCPKADEELLLRRVSSRGSSRSGSRSGSVSGFRSVSGRCGSRGSSGSRSGSSSRSSSRGCGGFGFATSGHSQGEEGSDEERLLHFSEILNVMEVLGQLVDRNVAVSVNE